MSEQPEIEHAQRLEDFRGRTGSIRVMLESPGWAELAAVCAGTYRALIRQLLDPSQDRKNKTSDDYLRGQLETLNLILNAPLDLVERFGNIVRESEAALERLRTEGVPDPWSVHAVEHGMRAAGFPLDPDFTGNPEGSES